MTQQSIKDFAMTVAPNTKVYIYTKTAVKMNKKDVATKSIPNPYQEIFKVSSVLVTLNASYEDRVNEQRVKEGHQADFKAEEMKYGKMIGNAVLENNDQLYIKCIEEEKIGRSTYVDANDNVISYDDIKPFIPVSKSSPKQDLDTEIKVRNYKLSSITGFEVLDNQ